MTGIALAIVVPCYNEEEVLPETLRRLEDLLAAMKSGGLIAQSSAAYFVDDGSTDSTWSIIEASSRLVSSVNGIKLSRNFGHQNAMLAGLMSVPGDAIVSVDADLQDDLGTIRKMVEAHKSGSDIVYGVRSDRSSDAVFKRSTAETYYRLLRLMQIPVVFNHADFRLMSRRAVEALREYGEVNLFIRGIIAQLGFSTATITYVRRERLAGVSKYPVSKMLSLAAQGVTSFSSLPLRVITATGLALSILSFCIGVWALIVFFLSQGTVPGWASTVIPMYFLGGIQLLSLGVIGEYLGKIYLETKSRPRYIIEDRTFQSVDCTPPVSPCNEERPVRS